MRPASATVLQDTLASFAAHGVDVVAIDPDEFAGLTERLHAGGAIPFEHVQRVLRLGGIRLGNAGTVKRFVFVPRSEEPRPEGDNDWSEDEFNAAMREWGRFAQDLERRAANARGAG